MKDKHLPQVRVSEEELDIIYRKAKRNNMSMSDWMRSAAILYEPNFGKPVRSSFCDKIARWFGR